MGKHITTHVREGVTVAAIRAGLFDVLPETNASAPLAAEVVAEFRSAVAGAGAVVVDLRRAGKVSTPAAFLPSRTRSARSQERLTRLPAAAYTTALVMPFPGRSDAQTEPIRAAAGGGRRGGEMADGPGDEESRP